MPTTLPSLESADCVQHDDFNTQMLVLSGICIFFGFIMCLLGYKLFKFILFMTGFLVGFFATYVICSLYLHRKLSGNAKEYKDLIYLALSFGVGIIGGFLTLCLYYLGMFLLGATMGWFLGMAILPCFKSQAHFLASNMWLPYSICSGAAILVGIVMLCLQKIVIIISTSFLGALMVINGIDYYIEKGRAMNFTIQILHGNHVYLPNCWYTWFVLSILPILTIVGFIVQYMKTSKGADHRLASGMVLVVETDYQMHDIEQTDESTRPLLL